MKKLTEIWILAAGIILSMSTAGFTSPPALFTDNFDNGASPLWGNEVGAWSAAGGVYFATLPNNNPQAYSSLPFTLTDFTMEFDINNVRDGGVWLRSTPSPGTAVGIKGVLLVLKNPAQGLSGNIYWHTTTDGKILSLPQGVAYAPYTSGSSPHVRVVVTGDLFQAFVNGSATPSTTITTSDFPSGRVALYDFSAQTFDNVVLVPEPASALLLGFSALCLWFRNRRVTF
jgi:hypothetical protein